MGLFFNYDKPGPGVEKNAPRKKGIFLFFELLGRNFGKLMLANMLYFAVSLPVLLIYYVLVSYFLGTLMPGAVGSLALLQTSIIITVLVAILWGTGPVSSGYTYILRNAVREEHTFLVSDFFEKGREGFLHGLVFFAVDVVMLISFLTAILTYWGLSAKMGGIYTVLLYLTVLMVVIYTIMHFYLYEMEVTFKDGVIRLYKNSFLLAFATMPVCLMIGILIVVLSFALLKFLTPVAILVVAFLCWTSLMRFIVDFYTARVIKNNILSKYEKKEE